jgi:hypothetical protein
LGPNQTIGVLKRTGIFGDTKETHKKKSCTGRFQEAIIAKESPELEEDTGS